MYHKHNVKLSEAKNMSVYQVIELEVLEAYNTHKALKSKTKYLQSLRDKAVQKAKDFAKAQSELEEALIRIEIATKLK